MKLSAASWKSRMKTRCSLLFPITDSIFPPSFHTNTWLWQNGLLALKDGKKP